MWHGDEDLAFTFQINDELLEDFYVSLVYPVDVLIAWSANRGHQGVVWWELDVLRLFWL